MSQVLINLVGNACKFTHKGYIAVDVSIVCSTCHQEFFLGQKQCAQCISKPTAAATAMTTGTIPVMGEEKHPQNTEKRMLENGLNRSTAIAAPDTMCVHTLGNGEQERYDFSVENIRTQMSLSENIECTTRNKVGGDTGDVTEGTQDGTIMQQICHDFASSEMPLKLPYASYKKRKKDVLSKKSEPISGVCETQANNHSRIDHGCKNARLPVDMPDQKEISDRVFFPEEFNKSISHCGEEEQLSPIQMPHQMLQWFHFSVIDTGIGYNLPALSSEGFMVYMLFMSWVCLKWTHVIDTGVMMAVTSLVAKMPLRVPTYRWAYA